jgi:hypothetical protein
VYQGQSANCFAANNIITGMCSAQNGVTDLSRISGYSNGTNNCYANSSMTINGSTVSSINASSKNGA